MISSFSFRNFKTFDNEVNVSFTADGQIKRFTCNTIESSNKKILKTVGVYGPNNTGKTCFILALANLKSIMLNLPHEELCNIFIDDNTTVFNVEYIINGTTYKYDVDYDCKKKEYIKEKLSIVSYAPSNPSVATNKILIERNKDKINIPELNISDGLKRNALIDSIFSQSMPIVMMLNFSEETTPNLYQAKKDYINFANSIILIRNDFSNIDLQQTMNLIKNDKKASKFISEFIKNCDLHISEFGYDDNVSSDVDISSYITNIQNKESLKFYSVHNNHKLPSFIFDSIGTQKIIALSGFIYSALSDGGILLIDEIDGSLHHILTKAIISLFNNELNKKAQLIFTTHDLLLLDVEKMFRKDQIYLTNVDNNGVTKISSLNISSRDEGGIRGNEDIIKYYLQGRFGKVPSPELFECLEDIVNDK